MEPKHSNNSNSKEDARQLTQFLPIENSPFTAVKVDERWMLTMGKYRLTQPIYSNVDEVTEEANNTSWHRIMQIIQIMIDEDHIRRNTPEHTPK